MQHHAGTFHLLAQLHQKALGGKKWLGSQTHVRVQTGDVALLGLRVDMRHQRPGHALAGKRWSHEEHVNATVGLQIGKPCNGAVSLHLCDEGLVGSHALCPWRGVIALWCPGIELLGCVVLARQTMHRGKENGAQRGLVTRAKVADVDRERGRVAHGEQGARLCRKAIAQQLALVGISVLPATDDRAETPTPGVAKGDAGRWPDRGRALRAYLSSSAAIMSQLGYELSSRVMAPLPATNLKAVVPVRANSRVLSLHTAALEGASLQ